LPNRDEEGFRFRCLFSLGFRLYTKPVSLFRGPANRHPTGGRSGENPRAAPSTA